MTLQHVESISFTNATVVRDAAGNAIAAFWTASTAANYVDLLTADESVGRLTDERDSARLKCVALEQKIAEQAAALEAMRWIPVSIGDQPNPIKPEVGRMILRLEEYGDRWRHGICKYEGEAQLLSWTHWCYFPAPPVLTTNQP